MGWIENIDGVLDGVRGFGPARKRALQWLHSYYHQGLQNSTVPCLRCNQTLPLHHSVQPEMPQELNHCAPATPGSHGVWAICHTCQIWSQTDIEGLAGQFPEVIAFEQKHKRVITLPSRTIETAGGPTIVVSLQKLGGTQQLDLLFNRRTLQRVDP